MKVSRYYFRAQAKDIPPETTIYKDSPDPRSRKRLIPYVLTNKITLYNNGKEEVVQYAKKMLYLIDKNEDISFIAPDIYVTVPFDSIEELQDFLLKVKEKGG